MKRIIYLTSVLFAVIFLSACVHNNGNIGPWWGQWKIEKVELNGEPMENYEGNYFLRFQSSVITIVKSHPDIHSNGSAIGNWTEHEGVMDVEFKEGGTYYADLGMDKICRLDIIQRDGRTKILEYKKDDKNRYTYYIKSW